MKVPVLILAFNRSDHVSEAMKAIREYKPDRLYLECDGPRSGKEGEAEKVKATRKAMLEAIDWPCDVKTLFRENNLGCAHAVNDAITWFFEQEEYGIICEDDIILGQDFFKFCEFLLPRYAKEGKIMSISAQNHSMRKDINNTYVYSYCYDCWGWATWRRAWEKMDMSMSKFPTLSFKTMIRRYGLFGGIKRFKDFTNAYKNIRSLSSWATRFELSIIAENGIVIIPGANMAINIGMDGGAHYKKGDYNPYRGLKICDFDWPIVYNDSQNIDKTQESFERNDYLRVRFLGLRKKIKNIVK